MDTLSLPTDALVSSVISVQNAEAEIRALVISIHDVLARTASDYEIIVVDNASRDGTVAILESLSNELTNLQVYCLASRTSDDLARMVGIQQAIGDYVVLLDPYDDVQQIPAMLEHAIMGNDLVVAVRADAKEHQGGGLSAFLGRCFLRLYRLLSGYDLHIDAPRFRLMSRRVVNYVLQHEDAHITYQVLPLMGGFKTHRLIYTPSSDRPHKMMRNFRQAVSYAISLLMFTSAVPLRLVTVTCGLAASFSLAYSVYVILVYLLHEGTAEGWTTLSLQLSVQFLLLSLAIGMLAEYMVHLLRQTTKRPRFYIAREFRSGQITREQRLNVLQQYELGR